LGISLTLLGLLPGRRANISFDCQKKAKAFVHPSSEERETETSFIMPKFLKAGKVVIVLQGEYAGRKAVIVKTFDDGQGSRKYGHALIAGVSSYPKRVTNHMSKKKIAQRSRVRPFVKLINYNHLMPTRYGLDVDLKNVSTELAYGEKKQKYHLKRSIQKVFEDRYKTGKNRWFFTKLRF
jgi:large subunit ribosomal protein L27e